MRSSKELYYIINYHSKKIRESLGEAKYVHGEIYADTVFGALLSAVEDNEMRIEIVNLAFEKYRQKAAMCVSLERESVAADAMQCAVENGINKAITVHLGKSPDELLIDEYLNELKHQM